MLKHERDGAVAILTLDYPERRNALAMAMRVKLIEALDMIEGDREVRAIVLTGGSTHFSAGGDISGMNATDLAGGRERFRVNAHLIKQMIRCSKPIVAAVEGWCVGAGLSLALACDTIVAAESARFAAGFGKVGLIADLGLMHTLPARVGAGRARQILLYGEPMDGAAAAAIGLVDHLATTGAAFYEALKRAKMFESTAPLPVALTKNWLAEGIEAALEKERDLQPMLFLTADHAEGKAAFLEKRAPVFRGT